ncbi:hypothetical protein NEOKW01_0586 [Nematocida sp. AWRm80]|nr:hypothetical protein NEOKW01_0586 [Nematocida sp. AWRm80]
MAMVLDEDIFGYSDTLIKCLFLAYKCKNNSILLREILCEVLQHRNNAITAAKRLEERLINRETNDTNKELTMLLFIYSVFTDLINTEILQPVLLKPEQLQHQDKVLLKLVIQIVIESIANKILNTVRFIEYILSILFDNTNEIDYLILIAIYQAYENNQLTTEQIDTLREKVSKNRSPVLAPRIIMLARIIQGIYTIPEECFEIETDTIIYLRTMNSLTVIATREDKDCFLSLLPTNPTIQTKFINFINRKIEAPEKAKLKEKKEIFQTLTATLETIKKIILNYPNAHQAIKKIQQILS